ncbi:hypothetical protein H8B02_29125 [Bradyrhizobium sp. Pear77]|uniref:hypothetical protein n=1 Tax=Bradyrhizobium altum TaxID=1571202 RepID=UPI001E5F9C6A|nr:hypothetical protein [Bradyrhizobium altum]MCC8957352.1 hypothetical protein [Bradyrhizobium altum]
MEERGKIGSALDGATILSNLISEKQSKRVLDYISIGEPGGARVLTLDVEGHNARYFA